MLKNLPALSSINFQFGFRVSPCKRFKQTVKIFRLCSAGKVFYAWMQFQTTVKCIRWAVVNLKLPWWVSNHSNWSLQFWVIKFQIGLYLFVCATNNAHAFYTALITLLTSTVSSVCVLHKVLSSRMGGFLFRNLSC